MNNLRYRISLLIIVVLSLLILNGCSSLGSQNVPADRFNYNAAIAKSRNEQMLLNIIRLRYLDIPDFLAVSSVITTYSYEGKLGVGGLRVALRVRTISIRAISTWVMLPSPPLPMRRLRGRNSIVV